MGTTASSKYGPSAEVEYLNKHLNCEQSLILQGLDAAGKTTFIYQAQCQRPELFGLYKSTKEAILTTIPTIGFNVESCVWQDVYTADPKELKKEASTLNSWMTGLSSTTIQASKHVYQLFCWDVGGRDKIRPLWRHYYKNAKGLIFVIDMFDSNRRMETKDQMDILLSEQQLKSLPLIVYLNKRDLLDVPPSDRKWSPLKDFGMSEWMDFLGLHQTASFANEELESVLMDTVLGDKANEEMIHSLSMDITQLCFGETSWSVSTVESHPNPLMRRPIKVIQGSFLPGWNEFHEEGLRWLFETMDRLRDEGTVTE